MEVILVTMMVCLFVLQIVNSVILFGLLDMKKKKECEWHDFTEGRECSKCGEKILMTDTDAVYYGNERK